MPTAFEYPSKRNRLRLTDLLAETELLLSHVTACHYNIYVVGVFNVRLDAEEDTHALKFLHILQALGLTQPVTSSTHKNNHILDLVITRDDDNIAVISPFKMTSLTT